MTGPKLQRASRRFIAVGLWLLALGMAVPAEAVAAITANVHDIRLANGMTALVLENHKAPAVVFQIWYRAGARKEAWGKTGLAHVFEHLMFKGTEAVGREEFIRRVEERGGSYNAFTAHDYAAYFEILPSQHLPVAIRLEADRMRNLTITEEEFDTERKVVLEERRLRTEDQPEAYLGEQVRAMAFTAQPYHWPIVGWEDDLLRLTPEDAREFYDIYYRPSNAFIVIAGDVDTEDVVPLLEETFGTIPPGAPPARFRYSDPPQTGERRLVVRRPARLPYLMIGYQVPALGDPDSYALEVAAAVLSAGRSSRFDAILVRERELALHAYAAHPLLSIDPDLFTLGAQPRPGVAIDALEKALTDQIARLRDAPVPQEELERAKNQLAAEFVFAQDSFFYQGMLLAQHEIAGNWRQLDAYLEAVRAVRAEDIQRVARRYLVPERRVVGRLATLPLARETVAAEDPPGMDTPPPAGGPPPHVPYRPLQPPFLRRSIP